MANGPAHPGVPRVTRLPRFRSAVRHGGEQQVPMHTHDAAELVYTVGGDLIIDCDGKSLPARDRMLYILPAKVPHNQRANGKWQTWCILYYDGDHIVSQKPRTLDLSATPEVPRFIDELCRLHELKDSVSPSVCEGLLFALLNRLAEIEHARQDIDALHPRLAAAVKFIHEHSTEDFDAETLSSAACASYSHLGALFRERFGCGPLKYQQNLRMELARKLLLNPYLSMDEVAQQTGFADTNYFVRLFRKSNGVPPGQWRKRQGLGVRG
ncbi:MAG TPA: AraC family transcriptional regulator [Planctomycetota bacterium]|nr:AraC family transcriptional regulator [Planctomycetota bacterium]